MAIQSEPATSPFSLAFEWGKGEQLVRVPIRHFVDQPTLTAASRPAVRLRENSLVRVDFRAASPDTRLYIDGLDALPEEQGPPVDWAGQPYLSPSEQARVLFSPENYPLIPGYYWLCVSQGEHRWFALVEVYTKEMSQQHWEMMRDDLERELQGLALDVVRRVLGVCGQLEMEVLVSEKSLA